MDPVSIAAIGWGFSAAGWLISPVLTRLLNKCYDALGIDSRFQSQKEELVEKLEKLQIKLLPQLLILIDAAQKSPYQPILEKWLQDLKSAYYEIEHVLSLVEYQRLEKEVNSLPSTSKSISKKLKDKESDLRNDLIKSLENLENIVEKAMKSFAPLMNLPSSSGSNSTLNSNEPSRETSSTPGFEVIGRAKDRDYIVNLLRGNISESTRDAKSFSIMGIWGMGGHIVKLLCEYFSQSIINAKSYFVTRIWGMSGNLLSENFSESTSDAKSYSVIGIWGMGGSGKTTLAQYVCEYEKADKYFDCVLWAHVSEKFSVAAIFKKILESAFKEPCPDFSLEGLQSKLEEKLRGKMFFLVLDDIWCDKGVSEQELEQLFAPLRAGKRGSKILVTTRIEATAKALGAMDLMILPELADDVFMSLFMSHALSGIKANEHLEEKLRPIGEKIVKRLCRSPLAAKTVAGQLRRRLNPEFWKAMLKKKNLLKVTMGALVLSYQQLPPSLQRCFAFCSLFPKGHPFKHDHLVNLWIAEGFIETEDSNEHMKDIAGRYILELISSSFFQVDESYHYYMHDLIHDLAQDVSEGEYFRIESGEKKEIPAHTRHIFCVDSRF